MKIFKRLFSNKEEDFQLQVNTLMVTMALVVLGLLYFLIKYN